MGNANRIATAPLYRLHELDVRARYAVQAVTLAAIAVEQDNLSSDESFWEAPPELRAATKACLPLIETLLAEDPQAWDTLRQPGQHHLRTD